MNDWKSNLPNALNPLRVTALENAINSTRRASNAGKLDDQELSETVEAWQRVLVGVPTDQLMRVATEAQRAKTNGYPVSASEVYDVWDKPLRETASMQNSQLVETWHVQMGMREPEEELRRIRAFQESERARRKLSARVNDFIERGVCDCELPAVLSKNKRVYQCAANRCGFAYINSENISEAIKQAKTEGRGHLIEVPDGTWGQMPDAKLPEIHDRAVAMENSQAAPPTDDEILAAVRDGCRIDVEALGREDSISFGRYIVANIGVAGLNEHDALALWDEWRVLEPESIAPPVHRAVEVGV